MHSAIAPSLFEAAIAVVSDTETFPGQEAHYPIHEALNWELRRFTRQARRTQRAALLLNEDGSCWQAKLESPLRDKKNNKVRKYETPAGNGSRAYLPEVPSDVRARISERLGVCVPSTGSFWQWVAAQRGLPIILAEGGKKSLSLLSFGYIAISLYGVNGGYRSKDRLGNKVTPYLIDDLVPFITEGRPITLAFDQDEKQSTRSKVALALSRFGSVLEHAGAVVRVAEWSGAKGVDDLIVSYGIEAFDKAYAEALSLSHWRIAERLRGQLLFTPQLRVHTQDLSSLDTHQIPQSGIVAIASAKGTGKTKYIGSIIESSEKALCGTHRIALGRNLSKRLGLDWRGDIDKVCGQFINGSAYTLRIGFCVDSLLAIDPGKFSGCDLIVDEVVQVLRHLLTSSTCAKDGKRPALLARFRELVQSAQRVIVADADLDDASLRYLQSLRGEEDSEIFLIRNDYQGQGYPVRFIDAPDRSAITAEILESAANLPEGKVLFICTDSKGYSKVIGALLADRFPEKRVLVINAETSGGDLERAFIESPDTVLAQDEYDIVAASPSMGTGVSVEAQGRIWRVYGVFMGASSTDADMAQALGRVREPVERVVWCARVGNNRDAICKTTNVLEFKRALLESTAATVRLVRSSLREDVAGELESIDWQGDPHISLYCRFATERNFAMEHLRSALYVRLRLEGNQVEVEERLADQSLKILLKEKRQVLKELEAESLLAAPDFSQEEILQLQTKETLSVEEQQGIAKFYFLQFYCLESASLEQVLKDDEGRWRSQIVNLECLLHPEVSQHRTKQSIERQASWNKSFVPWDLSRLEQKRKLREVLGLPELLEKMQQGWEWRAQDIAPYASRARSLARHVRAVLSFSIHDKVTDAQIVHQLLEQMGIKVVVSRWHCPKGEKRERVYTLDRQEWEALIEIVEHRWQRFQDALTPSPEEEIEVGGVSTLSNFEEGLLELLQEAVEFGGEAVRAIWDATEPASQSRVLPLLPLEVQRLVG